MVLTKSELLTALQNESRILMHLIGKIDRSSVDYRPTPKQRSTLDLLRYLSIMGPTHSHGQQPGRLRDMESGNRGRERGISIRRLP
jgi:hypothetical protein